jgi:hypothetical protein
VYGTPESLDPGVMRFLLTEELAKDESLYGVALELLLYTHLEANYCRMLWEDWLVGRMRDRLENGNAIEKVWTMVDIVKTVGILSWKAGLAWLDAFGPRNVLDALGVVSDPLVRVSSLEMLGWILYRARMAGGESWSEWSRQIGEFVGAFAPRSEEERRKAGRLRILVAEGPA